MTEDALIKKCKKNNLEAQHILYLTYKDRLFMLCLKYCNSRSEAEDHLHDTFIEIFKSIKKFNNRGSFEGWLKRIVINMAINKYKTRKLVLIDYNHDILEDTGSEFDFNLNEIKLKDLLDMIQKLPTQYRLVFSMYELDDYSHKEISEALKISVNTSKSNLHRAKQILKRKIIELKKANLKTLNYGN